MFYDLQLLRRQSGGSIGLAWEAAWLRKLDNETIRRVDIIKLCTEIIQYIASDSVNPKERMSLRLSVILTRGVTIIFNKQVKLVLDDISKFLCRIHRPLTLRDDRRVDSVDRVDEEEFKPGGSQRKTKRKQTKKRKVMTPDEHPVMTPGEHPVMTQLDDIQIEQVLRIDNATERSRMISLIEPVRTDLDSIHKADEYFGDEEIRQPQPRPYVFRDNEPTDVPMSRFGPPQYSSESTNGESRGPIVVEAQITDSRPPRTALSQGETPALRDLPIDSRVQERVGALRETVAEATVVQDLDVIEPAVVERKLQPQPKPYVFRDNEPTDVPMPRFGPLEYSSESTNGESRGPIVVEAQITDSRLPRTALSQGETPALRDLPIDSRVQPEKAKQKKRKRPKLTSPSSPQLEPPVRRAKPDGNVQKEYGMKCMAERNNLKEDVMDKLVGYLPIRIDETTPLEADTPLEKEFSIQAVRDSNASEDVLPQQQQQPPTTPMWADSTGKVSDSAVVSTSTPLATRRSTSPEHFIRSRFDEAPTPIQRSLEIIMEETSPPVDEKTIEQTNRLEAIKKKVREWDNSQQRLTVDDLIPIPKNRKNAALTFMDLLVLRRHDYVKLIREENSIELKFIEKGRSLQ